MNLRRHHLRLPPCSFLLVMAAFCSLLFEGSAPARTESFVTLATYDGVITPVSAEYFHDAVLSAQESGAEALIFRLNTPGGLDTSMRLIIKDITAAGIPPDTSREPA